MDQFDAIKQYLSLGGCVLIMLGEGGEAKFDTNVNFLLEEYGIMVNNGESLFIVPVLFALPH